MNLDFTRGGDIKETLKIGRRANAVKVKYLEIYGEVVASLDPSSITNEMLVKYNIKDNNKIKFKEDFVISELALETALVILNRDGICSDFNDYIIELIFKKFHREKSKKKFKFDENINPEARVVWVLVVSEKDVDLDLPKAIRNRFQLTFDRTGLDLMYKNELYRIAPPKDGGLNE